MTGGVTVHTLKKRNRHIFPGQMKTSSIHAFASVTFSRGKNEPDPGRERLPGSEHAQQSRDKMNDREVPVPLLSGSRSQGIGSVLNGFETISTFGQIESSENPDQTDLESNEPDEWMGWVGGEEFGPIGYSELLTWAVIGRLSPMDFVRRGGEGQYVPAVNIPCLFTIRAAADSLSRRVIPIPQASPAPNSESEVTIEPCPGSALMETTTITDWTFDFKK